VFLVISRVGSDVCCCSCVACCMLDEICGLFSIVRVVGRVLCVFPCV